jgi:PAT family beta-lactamase induction signal transducer AmpG
MTTPSTTAPTGAHISLRTKLLWVAAFYFAQGFPYGIVNQLGYVYLSRHGVAAGLITKILSDVGWAWVLKPLWAPLIDRFRSRKWWVVASQIALAITTLSLAFGDPTASEIRLWVTFATLAILSATQDIAIDGFSIELLEKREMGPANGVRVTAYRVALIVAGGLLVILAGYAGWAAPFVVAAALLFIVAGISSRVPGSAHRISEHWIVEPLRDLLRRPLMLGLLVFILLFKLGDYALTPVIPLFWVNQGYSDQEIGFVQGTLGMIATILGAIAGGVLTLRWGTFRALWILGLVQALSNLAYYAAATASGVRPVIYGAVIVEQFTQGLGTAAFLTFLMTLCQKRYAAVQFALLSSIFAISRWGGGRYSGTFVEEMGYAPYFLLTFVLALPAFALLPLVRRALARGAEAND